MLYSRPMTDRNCWTKSNVPGDFVTVERVRTRAGNESVAATPARTEGTPTLNRVVNCTTALLRLDGVSVLYVVGLSTAAVEAANRICIAASCPWRRPWDDDNDDPRDDGDDETPRGGTAAAAVGLFAHNIYGTRNGTGDAVPKASTGFLKQIARIATRTFTSGSGSNGNGNGRPVAADSVGDAIVGIL
eukprot:scaffold83396_cov55-Attheya_sp.AAC.2